MLFVRYFCFTILTSASCVAQAACLPPASSHQLQFASNWYLVDGDTLHLADRKKLRLAMINTPELGRDGRPDQPFAQAAKLAVQDFLAQGTLYWQPGKEDKDRYGRWLGSVFNVQYEWLAAHLVERGLAYVISVGDNVAPTCLWQLEAQARYQQLGLWSSDLGRYQHSQSIGPAQAGFMLLRGQVEKIARAGAYWYVDLSGTTTLKIEQQQWLRLGGDDPHNWLGQEVAVRGWVSWRELSKKQRQRGFKPARLLVQHPHMLSMTMAD